MKSILFFLIFVTCATRLLADRTIQYPEDKPAFTISFPDDWEVKIGKSVLAGSADGLANVVVLTLSAKEAETAIEVAKEVMDEYLEGMEWQGEPEKGELNDMPVTFLSGKCSFKGIKMSVSSIVFAPKKKKSFFMLFNFVPKQLEEKHGEALSEIINSVEG